METQNIDIDRAKNTLTKLLLGFGILGYIGKYFDAVYYEVAFIFIILGLLQLVIMDRYRKMAEVVIDGKVFR